jgi:imidazole glycerol-phosphate synthase subunit HisH
MQDPTIGLIDYSMGNLLSVYNALETLGATVRICQSPDELLDVDRIVLPGVGAFRDCMLNLQSKGFTTVLEEMVIHQGKPILGICLGMQAMARRSFEGGEHRGLGWFEADVVRLQPNNSSLRVPQVGWNDILYRSQSPLFLGLTTSPDFYFVHSYYMKCEDDLDVDATCDYGGSVTAAVRKNNIFATQFHPEKSQDYGLQILDNFLNWNP